MKRRKKLCLMLGVLGVLCVMTLAVSMVKEQKEHIQISGETILSVPVDRVQAFTWTEGEDVLSFRREGDRWVYGEDEQFPASTEKVEDLLRPFEAFGAAFTIEDVEDPGLYGLGEPAATLELETAEQTYEIAVGDYSKMDEQRYVSIGDGKVYLAAQDPCTDFSDTTLRSLILHDRVPAWGEGVERLTFRGEQESYEIVRQDSGPSYRPEDVWYMQQAGEQLPLDPVLVEDYLSQLNSGILYNYTDYHAEGEELAAYGLDDPELTVEVTCRTEDGAAAPFVLHIGRDPEAAARWEAMTEEEREKAEPVPAFARVEGSHIVYRLDSTAYDGLARYTVSDLRHRSVLPAELTDLRSLEVRVDGAVCLLTAREKDGALTWYDGGEEPVQTDLSDALSELRITEFTDEQPGDTLELSFTAVLDLEQAPAVEVELFRRDGGSCLAAVDGKPLGLVSRSAVVDLKEAVNRILLDRK